MANSLAHLKMERGIGASNYCRLSPDRLFPGPGYSGVILMWIGAGFATLNWMAAAIVILAMGVSYHYRIVSEEAMLMTTFGEQYQTYKAHTWRLLPFVY